MSQGVLVSIATFTLIVITSAAVIPTPVLNRCPQPSDPAYPITKFFLYSHPDNCTSFFICGHGNPTISHCPAGTRFSEEHQVCVHPNSEFDTCIRKNAARECANGATGLIPHPTACQRYYDCSDTSPRSEDDLFEPFEKECSYPNLFDETELVCKPFYETSCGSSRIAAVDACAYFQNQCLPTSQTTCPPCFIRFPSCRGQTNGAHENPFQLWSNDYIECDRDRLVNQPTCTNHNLTGTKRFFSPIAKTCVTIWEVPRFTGFGLRPSCAGRASGLHRERNTFQVYYRCPGSDILFCNPGFEFDESSQQCVKTQIV